MMHHPNPITFDVHSEILSLPMQCDCVFCIHAGSRQDANVLADVLEKHSANDGIRFAMKQEELASAMRICKHWALSTTYGTACNTRLAAERLVQPLGGETKITQATLFVTLDQEMTIAQCGSFMSTVFNAIPDQCLIHHSVAIDVRPGISLVACLLMALGDESSL